MSDDKGYVGKMFINKVKKDGKFFKEGDTYLRGTVGGQPVVAFLSRDGLSFNVKKDDTPPKGEFHKKSKEVSKEVKKDDKAPF